ncbi:MAG: hypothetical protein WCT14_22020 [Treponemataceae bacterium]
MKGPKKENADRSQAAFWNSIALGDFVSLSDFQSMADSGGSSLDCRVLGIRDIEVKDSGDDERVLARYRLHELEGPKNTTLFFLVISSGEEFELRNYFIPSEFTSGTRDDLVDSEQTWLFLPPPNPDDFVSSDLEFAPYPDAPEFAEPEGAKKRVWAKAGFGRTVYGSYELGNDEVPVMIAEYQTDEVDAPNPHLMVLEERWMNRRGEAQPSGGLVTVFLGCSIDSTRADVFPA